MLLQTASSHTPGMYTNVSPLGELEHPSLWGDAEDCVMLGESLNPFEEKRLLDFASRKELWRQ